MVVARVVIHVVVGAVVPLIAVSSSASLDSGAFVGPTAHVHIIAGVNVNVEVAKFGFENNDDR
jgi:hypothetical protein